MTLKSMTAGFAVLVSAFLFYSFGLYEKFSSHEVEKQEIANLDEEESSSNKKRK